MISDKFKDPEVLKACGLTAAEAQYICTLADSFPDFNNSYYSDPRVLEIFTPVFQKFVNKIETYLEQRLVSRSIVPPPPPQEDMLIKGRWVDGQLVVERPKEPAIEDQLIMLKPPGTDEPAQSLASVVNAARSELFVDVRAKIARCKELEPQLQIFMDNPDHSRADAQETEYRLFTYFQHPDRTVLYNNFELYEYMYDRLKWDYVGRPSKAWPVSQSFEMEGTSVFECNTNQYSPEQLCKQYGLAYMTFPEHFTAEDRNAYMNRFVLAADEVCSKMGYEDKIMFGQAGALGLNFYNYCGGTAAGTYTAVMNCIQIQVPSVSTIVHEYGHRLDHYIGQVAYEHAQPHAGNTGFATSRLGHRVANSELHEAFDNMYSKLDRSKHGYDSEQLSNPIKSQTKFKNVLKSIKNGDFLGAVASIRDLAEGKVYWNDRTEKFARAFDVFVTQNVAGYRLEVAGHLSRFKKAAIGLVKAITPVKLDEMNEVFDKFVENVSKPLQSQLTERCMLWNAVFNTAPGVKPEVEGLKYTTPPPLPPPLPVMNKSESAPPPLPESPSMGM